jgi:hypothetical protein
MDMIGFEGKVYWDDTPLAGAPGTATWTELGIAKDVTTGQAPAPAEVTMRKHLGLRAFIYGLTEETLDLTIAQDTADAGYIALWTAYTTRAEIAIAAMDGHLLEGGMNGLAGNWIVSDFGRAEALGDHMVRTVKLKPSSYMAEYTIADPSMDNAITSVDEDGEEKTATGDRFGPSEGQAYVTDHATWGSETKKNLCVVDAWAADSIDLHMNMAGFMGAGETAYLWVVTAHGIVSSNSDSFTYTIIP